MMNELKAMTDSQQQELLLLGSRDRVPSAIAFCALCHGQQKRNYTGELYVTHPIEVALEVSAAGGSEDMVIAALLHDVVEDCGVTIEEIESQFGPVVAGLVAGLTDVSQPSDGNRAARKALDRAHLAEQCADCQTIKLADIINNSLSIEEHDPKFAAIYMPEMRDLLAVLIHGHPELLCRARAIVDLYFERNAKH